MTQGPLQRKKLDSRVVTLLQNGVQTGHRSFFVIVGDKGREQVVNLHFLLSKARVSARPSVLWCYKKELGFSSHRKKRMNQMKKLVARGMKDPDQDDPFDLFISSTNIRYTYYKETQKILGQTFGMCVLQDFEALTPNLLARTVETVEGGGVVVLLLRTMSSLKQLYTMTMDVHSRYRTESHSDVVARFNERFLLSLGECGNCLVVDDELNVLPLSMGKSVKPIKRSVDEKQDLSPEAQELAQLKSSLQDTQPIGSLVSLTKTLDQAKALLTFVDAVSSKNLRTTVSLTASRGRGKSAALGISIAAAISYGYSNIFITSPSPENLQTVFEFVFKGFDALGYEEHLDYDIIQSTNPKFQKAIVRVNIFRSHRQTIQYIQPEDSHVLSQAELVVIDEAAAIPLPLVKKLLGNYLVFMSSTINGYEGTGRSLSLKLLQQLREQSRGLVGSGSGSGNNNAAKNGGTKSENRELREIKLETPIRYAPGDAIEEWLNNLLCLDVCTPTSPQFSSITSLIGGVPHPDKCDLFYVNRDTLFSYHPVSEAFLKKVMTLCVAGHYKNSPNDLQLMSDAPSHHLFVLLPPFTSANSGGATLPEPLVVIQVCMEGSISKQTILSSLARGKRMDGDLIPWCVSQQFQDDDFGQLSGARIVRIATHPDLNGMGYGSKAMKELMRYFEGEMAGLDEFESGEQDYDHRGLLSMLDGNGDEAKSSLLHEETIAVREASKMPALLMKLTERKLKEKLDWIGVSYGLTGQLHKFWKRLGFAPVYMRQTANDLTGEHTCIMLKTVKSNTPEKSTWLSSFSMDFKKRFLELLGFQFRQFSPIVVLSIVDAVMSHISDAEEYRTPNSSGITSCALANEVRRVFSPYDLKRLESYANNMLDYHVILDLVPIIARQYFLGLYELSDDIEGRLLEKQVRLSPVQAAVLVGIGLQKKTVEELEKEMELPSAQLMALFIKIVRKVSTFLDEVIKVGLVEQNFGGKKRKLQEAVEEEEEEEEGHWDPTVNKLDDDLEEGADEVMTELKEKQRQLINGLDLSQFAIGGAEDEWEKVKLNPNAKASKTISIANSNSTKALKKVKKGVADDMSSKLSVDQTGIYDPKGLMKKGKGPAAAKNKRR